MIRFLIADDEAQIRRGLKSLITSLVGSDAEFLEAEDGVEAYEQALAGQPDILLLDIHMPRLKGLDLVKKLNDLGRDWITIVVTGHDEFEYARTALSLQVFDFLLKPVPESQFGAVIERARRELEKRREERQFNDWSKERLTQQKAVLREGLWRDFLAGTLTEEEFHRSGKYLDIQAPARPAIVVVGADDDRRWFLPVRQTALAWPGAVVIEDTEKNIVVIHERAATGGWEALARLLEATLEASLGKVPPLEGLDLESASDLPDAWKRLITLLGGGEDSGLVQIARAYLENHYWQPGLNASEVADKLKITPGYLSRLLKAATGRTFVAALIQLRMEKACLLLADARLRIAEVAERVGYRDQNYFCRHFKMVMNATPSAWRSGTSGGDA